MKYLVVLYLHVLLSSYLKSLSCFELYYFLEFFFFSYALEFVHPIGQVHQAVAIFLLVRSVTYD